MGTRRAKPVKRSVRKATGAKKKWRVKVSGINFRWAVEDDRGKAPVRRMGFVTHVFVTAGSPADAETRAVGVLRKDKRLRLGLHNAKDDPPRLFVEEIVELRSFQGCRLPRTGLLIYPERGRKRMK